MKYDKFKIQFSTKFVFRIVNSEGVIDTLIGDKESQSGPPKPPECKRIFTGGKIKLQWPTKLALSPLDNTLHIVDDAMVLRLTPDMRLQAVAGVSPLCDKQLEESKELANRRKLSAISDIDFGPDGTLYVVETSSRKKKKSNIFHVNHFGKITQIEAMQSFNNGTDSSTVLQSALAISISPDETIYVANDDQLAKIVRKMPQPDKVKIKLNLAVTMRIFAWKEKCLHQKKVQWETHLFNPI